MEAKKIKVTNRNQFEELIRQMEENPSLAKGLKYAEGASMTKQVFDSLWNQISAGLNSLGPPTRTSAQWQKVWTDQKAKVKQKLRDNKVEVMATGGGPNKMHSFSANEEAIINLLSLDKAVNHDGAVFGLPVSPLPVTPPQMASTSSARVMPTLLTSTSAASQPMASLPIVPELQIQNPVVEIDYDLESFENVPPVETSTPRPPTQLNIRKRKAEETAGLLHQQTGYLKQITENSEICAKYARRMYHLAEEKFKFKKEHLLREEKRKAQDLEYKMALLEYKRQKLDFQKSTHSD